MKELQGDILKVLSLLEYKLELALKILKRGSVGDKSAITVQSEDLKKYNITFYSFDNALRWLQESEPIKIVSYFDENEDLHLLEEKGPDIDLYKIELPKDFKEICDHYVAAMGVSSKSVIQIFIDKEWGIYRERDGKHLSYPIKHNSKRFGVIDYIRKNERVSVSELNEVVNQTSSLTIKEIKGINELFKKKLELEDDLIFHLPTKGYVLNPILSIKFKY